MPYGPRVQVQTAEQGRQDPLQLQQQDTLHHNVAAAGEGHGADDQQLFLLKALVMMLADDM